MRRKLLCFLMLGALFIGSAYAQERRIIGRVTSSEDGAPIAGVSVLAVGANTATQTDALGTFTLVAGSSVKAIEFRYLGYVSQTISLGTTNQMEVVLVPDATALTEVVVTALGISREKRAIGYSTSTVGGDDLIKSAEPNVIQGLAAKATGVQVTSSSGTPGASSKIVLRGPATFSGDNQPLIVIDGVPMDNSVNNIRAGDDPYNANLAGVQLSNRAVDINPDDIESVTVLKGPAAAALYGQAAGNGAIIYTTKRGKFGQGLGITFSSAVEMQHVSQLPELQSRYSQGAGGVYSSSTPNGWGENLATAGRPTFDNLGDFFQMGAMYNNNLAIAGGNDRTTLRLSVGTTNQKGIVPNSKFDRYSFRLTSDTKLSDAISVGGTINYVNSSGTRAQNGSNLAGVMLALLRMPAEFNGSDYLNEDGTQKNYFSSYDNPYYSVLKNPFTDETDRLVGNFYTDAKLSDIFTLSAKLGTDLYNTRGTQIYSLSSRGDDNATGLGEVKRTNVAFRNIYTDVLLKFNSKLGDSDFSVSGLLGGNFNYSQFQSTFGRGRELVIPDFYNFNNFKELYVSNDDSYQNNKAIFLDATFDYRKMVFLTLTGRNEWSTTFGKNSKGFFYPKADLSFVFSDLLPQGGNISFGKVRLAYSNVGIAPTVYNDRTYYVSPFIADGMTNGLGFPYLGQPGFAISSVISGFGLVPERNEGLEAGLEMEFFADRLRFDLTLYEQRSSNLLLSQPVSPSSGFEYKYNNIGKIRNRGVELGVSGSPVKTEDFQWNIGVNWSKNVNEVTELAPGVDELSVGSGFADPQSFAMVGKPFGVIYGTKFQRNDNGQVLIDPGTGRPLTMDTEQDLGSPIPDWLMNVNNEIQYKNLSFSFLWDIRKGGKIWNGTRQTLLFRGRAKETENRDQTYVIDGVYASGPNAGQPNTTVIDGYEYYANYLGAGGFSNELSIEDGSWFRLRSVDLSYRFNKLGALNNALQYIQLGVNLRNILLFTDYKGVDPETSLTGSAQNLSGYDYYNNPGTKSYSFNVRIGF